MPITTTKKGAAVCCCHSDAAVACLLVMIKRTLLTLTVICLLALLAAPSLLAQETLGRLRERNLENARNRERLRQVMSPAADVELFRRELADYLKEVEEAVRPVVDNNLTRDAVARSGLDPLGQLAEAQKKLQELSPDELSALRTGYARSAVWRDLPRVLGSVINAETRQRWMAQSAAREQRSVNVKSGIPDNCNDAKNANITLTDLSIAKAAEIAADAVMEGFPTDGLTIAARIAPIAVKAAAAGVVLSLETLNGILDNCLGDEFEAGVNAKLDDTVTSRASQTSVNEIKAGVTALQGSADETKAIVTAIKMTVDDRLDVKVSSRASQASVNTLQTTANIINNKVDILTNKVDVLTGKVDTLTAKLDAFQAQTVRFFIETNLLQEPRYNLAQLQTPQAKGGLLEQVRAIAADTIQKMKNSGLPVTPGSSVTLAEQSLAIGDQLFNSGAFKDAYSFYRQAYLHVSIVPNIKLP